MPIHIPPSDAQSEQVRRTRAARREAVLREIEQRIIDPNLSAASVAAALGVTPRYVHLLLKETGRTFSRRVLDKRLERAFALLRDPQWYGRKIADVAAETGFSNLSHFSRVFRRRYGAPPTAMRQRARHDGDIQIADDGLRDRNQKPRTYFAGD